MKQKLFTLLTLLLVAISSAWATDKYYILGAQAVASDGALTKASSHSNLTLKYIKYNGSTYSTTTDISFNATDGINGKFDGSAASSNISDILNSSKWATGSGSAYAACIKFAKNTTYTLALGTKKISSISLLYYPGGKNSSITIGGTEKTTSSQAWTSAEWTGTFTGNVSMVVSNANPFYGVFVLEVAPAGPTITTQPVGASYVTGDPISALTVAATASAGDLSYQWYSCDDANKTNKAAIDGKTSASYTPSAAGFYFVTVTDSNGSVDSNVVQISISDASAPTISIDASETSVTAGTSITLTATKDGVPTPTLKWFVSDTNDTSAGSEITGETADTYTFDAIAGTKYYYAKAFNSEAPEGVASNIITITAAARTGCNLNQVVFSNGFDAFITDPVDAVHGTIKAYYLSGSSAPTIASTNKSGGSEYTLEGNTFTLTSEDGNTTKVYDVTIEAVEPYTEDGIKFNGTESWIKTGYTFHAERGWRFQKNSDDGRIPKGLTRLYFFVGHASSVKLINGGITSARDVYVYVNGVQQGSKTSVPKNDADPNYITIPCNSGADNMIAIVSAQTSGDGGFTAIEVTGSEETAVGETITPAKEYTTYVPTHDLDFTTATELTAYIATAATASTVTMVSVDKVPAGTPIVIKATATGSPIAVSKAASTDDVSDNKLKIGDGSTSIGGDGKWDYILSSGKFYHASAGVLPAGKCYLHLDAEPAANELTMDFGDGNVTGIANINALKTEVNGEYYNLAGQRVAQPSKGLYIVNGKKLIVR